MNNTPPELGPRMWSLDFTPNVNGDVDLPGLATDWQTAVKPYPNGRWDPSLLAITPTLEFIGEMYEMTPGQPDGPTSKPRSTRRRSPATRPGRAQPGARSSSIGASAPSPAMTFIQNELNYLLQLREDERDRYLPELAGQADGAPGCFMSFLGIEQSERPYTTALIALRRSVRGKRSPCTSRSNTSGFGPRCWRPACWFRSALPAHAAFRAGMRRSACWSHWR